VAAAVVPVMAALLVVVDVGLLLAAWRDSRLAAATPLEARRTWPPLLVQGARSEVEVEIHNSSTRRVRARCREGLHPALADAPLSRGVELAPDAGVTWRYSVVPRRRGTPQVLPLSVRVQGPWGLAWAQRDLLPPQECRVYPQVRWQGRVGALLALAQRHELGSVPVGLAGRGGESYGLREYRAGDPLSTIHWKATARHGRLVSRELTWERGARLVILLDCARSMAAIDGGRSKLDHALGAALALARVASGRGDHVRVAAFSNRVLRVVRIPPGGGGVRDAYRALFDLEAELVEPSFDLAAELAVRGEGRRATVVLFSSVADLGAADLLREALLRLETRHRPLLVNLEDPELQTLARARASGVPEAFAKVSALGILVANRQLVRRMRRHGIRVLSVPADRLALEAIDAYLAMFAPRQGAAHPRTAVPGAVTWERVGEPGA
jgi:uncharacterized protein (DUF58 family)